ncbi:MAG: succinate dehydrogenase, cytochrome b556 subunit [Gammaproteobacteria bacterium]|nr:succinate dehydrogenase, cytochrome b556 subunit [Gammaproteobacteria bacterium]
MQQSKYPLSPHLQIYRLPLTAWLSITHRLTGVLLVVALLGLTAGLILIANNPAYWQSIVPMLNSPIIYTVLMAFNFSFWLHWFHGLRHLIWDTGSGFDLRYARTIDALEILFTVVMTIIVWIINVANT